MGSKPLLIPSDENNIRDRALKIWQENPPLDELIWYFAEMEVRLAPTRWRRLVERDLFIVEAPTALVVTPPREAIVQKAEEIAASNPCPRDLHWYLAERSYLFDQIQLELRN